MTQFAAMAGIAGVFRKRQVGGLWGGCLLRPQEE
jgi:hypothetical protein